MYDTYGMKDENSEVIYEFTLVNKSDSEPKPVKFLARSSGINARKFIENQRYSHNNNFNLELFSDKPENYLYIPLLTHP